MSIQATDFQRVLNVVGEWYRRSFRDLLVNGQYAIHDIDRQQIPYISMYQSKPLGELQPRGLVFGHGPYSGFRLKFPNGTVSKGNTVAVLVASQKCNKNPEKFGDGYYICAPEVCDEANDNFKNH